MSGDAAMADREAAIGWCIRLDAGDLSPAEHRALRDWLAGDANRQSHLDQALALWAGIEADAETPELIALRHEARDAMACAAARRPRAVLRRTPWQAIAAALALVAVALAALLWQQQGGAVYRTGIGERRVVALADGSRLSLDADSVVSTAFTDQRRDLTLVRGRARFKVAKNPLRPFAVHVGRDVVVATGTEFSVEALTGEIRVGLFEGHVAILHDAGRGPVATLARRGDRLVPAERALVPGSELRLAAGAAAASITPLAAGDGLDEGQLSFTAEPLAIAAERMNRFAGARRIVVAPAVADLRISGVFNAGDSDAFAQAVAATLPTRVEAGRDTLTLVAR